MSLLDGACTGQGLFALRNAQLSNSVPKLRVSALLEGSRARRGGVKDTLSFPAIFHVRVWRDICAALAALPS